MHIASAVFDRSCPDLEACPDESLPEFAFIGRSNVGKSSLLNTLAGKAELAKVSPVPGHTKLINIFTVNRTWRLVDLPGYGYAQVAQADSSRFNRAVMDYLESRANLCLVFALVDSGIAPQHIDVEFVEWLALKQVPFVLVFTKTDKSSADEVQANIAAFKKRIAQWFVQLPAIFTCSAKNEAGRPELLAVIDEQLTAIKAMSESAPSGPKNSPTPPRKHRPDRARPW